MKIFSFTEKKFERKNYFCTLQKEKIWKVLGTCADDVRDNGEGGRN